MEGDSMNEPARFAASETSGQSSRSSLERFVPLVHAIFSAWVVVSMSILVTSVRAETLLAQGAGQSVAAARKCADLQGLGLGEAKIVTASFAYPPFDARSMSSVRTVVTNVPFCRLEVLATPVSRSHIGVEVWLPAPDSWNGRFLGVGAGGSLGDINRPQLAGAVSRGFAAVATDNGHRSGGPRDGNQWALGEWERIVDFGHRGQAIATAAGKAAVRAYYGQDPKFSYFAGCSQGGQKAMLAAQRYPDDYDGILAGAPVFSWPDEMTMQAWTVRAFAKTPGSQLSVGQMSAIRDAVVAKCGGPNGLVGDPTRCDFEPDQLRCPLPKGKTCLTDEQIDAVRKAYLGPHTSSGNKILSGYARGSERGWEQFYAKVSADGTVGGGSWLGVYRYMVFEDPSWNLLRMDFDKDPATAKRKLGPVMDADSPDLDAFAKRGGKLLMYQGWADQQIPAEEAVDYYVQVAERYGQTKTASFFKLGTSTRPPGSRFQSAFFR